jgi:hypothetical protein
MFCTYVTFSTISLSVAEEEQQYPYYLSILFFYGFTKLNVRAKFEISCG